MARRAPRPRRSAELLHDLALAAGFGGSLMGAVGLTAARTSIDTEHHRIQALGAGWARWSLIAVPAVGAYALGAGTDWRARRTGMGPAAWLTELGLVAAATSLSAYGSATGSQIVADDDLPYSQPGHPPAYTPAQRATVQHRLRAVQWLVPALTGATLGLSIWTRPT